MYLIYLSCNQSLISIFVIYIYVFIIYYLFLFFFFNNTATTEIYTLSLHDALPILCVMQQALEGWGEEANFIECPSPRPDRKSTRLNSSHGYISYAVFCLKKKKKHTTKTSTSFQHFSKFDTLLPLARPLNSSAQLAS